MWRSSPAYVERNGRRCGLSVTARKAAGHHLPLFDIEIHGSLGGNASPA
jgi:hypothetical protein